jgi:dCMP deaminase
METKPKLSWEQYYLKIAEEVKSKSKDPRTQIGAVIVGEDNEPLSFGYNSFPRGINDSVPERQVAPEKYFWMVHAEENAILNAARVGTPLKNSTMYLTCGMPCSNCGRSIINSGIRNVYIQRKDVTKNTDKWNEEAIRTKQMFDESGVIIHYYGES